MLKSFTLFTSYECWIWCTSCGCPWQHIFSFLMVKLLKLVLGIENRLRSSKYYFTIKIYTCAAVSLEKMQYFVTIALRVEVCPDSVCEHFHLIQMVEKLFCLFNFFVRFLSATEVWTSESDSVIDYAVSVVISRLFWPCFYVMGVCVGKLLANFEKRCKRWDGCLICKSSNCGYSFSMQDKFVIRRPMLTKEPIFSQMRTTKSLLLQNATDSWGMVEGERMGEGERVGELNQT